MEKLYALKEKIIGRIEHDLAERGVDRMDTNEIGKMFDMVKDISEAIDHCEQAQYYRSVNAAMQGRPGYGIQGAGYGGNEAVAGYGTTVSVGYNDPGTVATIKHMAQSLSVDERERLIREMR